MDKELSQWLERVNLEMSNADVPYIRRPHHAFMRLSRERGMSVIIPSPLMNHISAWFRDRSPAAAHEMGSLFTSTFYYDSFFWKVEVKFGYGTVEIAPTDALTQMPEVIKNQLRQDVPAMARYVASWMNSVDYGWGMDDLKRGAELPKVGNYEFASKLTSGAHQQLTASARLLTETRVPNAKSLEAAASATEMFLKAYLALHASLSKEDAKKLGHKLGKLARVCSAQRAHADLDQLTHDISVFPKEVGARYDGVQHDNQRLWLGYDAALKAAVIFTRSLTKRDIRSQMIKP